MQYRKFGKLDWQVSALGFGCMRLPTTGEDKHIDEPEAIRMIRHAIDQGVNYVDTAYPYHGGQSEVVVGKALQDGYRERVRLATKLPSWLVNTAEDFDRFLNEQLGKLQTDHIDFYMLHSLDQASWHKLRDLGVLAWAEKAKAEGRIRHVGFSFHDGYEVFQEIVDAYDRWDFAQIQYNYMNEEEQAGAKGLEYAASKGLALVIMEPLLGGKLANVPEPVKAILDETGRDRTPADWALQWLWNKPEVSVVLSGMSAMDQVEGNLLSAATSGVGTLAAEDLAVFERVKAKYDELCPIPCTKCGYCMPCPNGVNIPNNLEIYNGGSMYGDVEGARQGYKWLPEEQRAEACIQCRQCEDLCPQSILISEWMPRVHQVLGEGAGYDCK
ncbi:MAG: aldo/keto reductase [Anaerolineae bacterium]